ncbi:MAG TPA: zinc ribbon domain-containing protein [Pseudomonadales bacterium]|nr:zinc ribbon domain-containing protein [Pseudomonadales bacterium]
MPIFEFQCDKCGATMEVLWRGDSDSSQLECAECHHTRLTKVVSRPSVHRNMSSKLAGLDPKYDKMVERAVKNTPEADPNRHLGKMKPFINPRPLIEK